MRKKGRCYWVYNLRYVSDTGRTIRLGYPYGTLADLDPLAGIEVDIATSQGFQQTGETVENLSVGGVERQISGLIIGDANEIKRQMLQIFAPGTGGRLYFNDRYYCDAVVKSVPEISVKRKNATYVIVLYCAYPYWKGATDKGYRLGGYTPAFRFPVNYSIPHIFGVKSTSAYTNCTNDGAVAVPFAAEFRAAAEVEHYGLINVNTLEELMINDTLTTGETVRIYRQNGRLFLEKTSGGVTESIFYALDEESDLFLIRPGDNLLMPQADSGSEHLTVTVSFADTYPGVYDGM